MALSMNNLKDSLWYFAILLSGLAGAMVLGLFLREFVVLVLWGVGWFLLLGVFIDRFLPQSEIVPPERHWLLYLSGLRRLSLIFLPTVATSLYIAWSLDAWWGVVGLWGALLVYVVLTKQRDVKRRVDY